MSKELLERGVELGRSRLISSPTAGAQVRPRGSLPVLDSAPFGIVVNKQIKRFYDEGEDFWPKRYAIRGGLIARQPDQIAYSIVDVKASACRE